MEFYSKYCNLSIICLSLNRNNNKGKKTTEKSFAIKLIGVLLVSLTFFDVWFNSILFNWIVIDIFRQMRIHSVGPLIRFHENIKNWKFDKSFSYRWMSLVILTILDIKNTQSQLALFFSKTKNKNNHTFCLSISIALFQIICRQYILLLSIKY